MENVKVKQEKAVILVFGIRLGIICYAALSARRNSMGAFNC
jgi:hypothetical protein